MNHRISAVPVDGGVRVDMTKAFAWSWGRVLRRLSLSYRRGNPLYALQRPYWGMTHASLLRQLYPEVAQSRRESAAFLRQHRDALADRALVERVRARWRGPHPVVLTHAEADEWIAVLGQLRLLCEVRPIASSTFRWVGGFQDVLVRAIDPNGFTGQENETAASPVVDFALVAAQRTPVRRPPDGLPGLRHTAAGSSEENGWQVVLHNDEVNSFATVHHVLRMACGHDDAQARKTTMEIHRSGRSALAVDTESDAEAMALRLTRLGLRASFGRVS